MRLFSFLVALLVLSPNTVFPQEMCGPQDYTSEEAPDFDCPGPEEEVLLPYVQLQNSIPVEEGETVQAPWSGALVHEDRLLYYGIRLRVVRRLRWLDRLNIMERYRIEYEFDQEAAIIRETLLEKQAEQQKERAVAAEQRATKAQAWYRSALFGFVLGVLVSAALAVAVVYIRP